MNKILKILSILIVGFVMFSCSTPTNDPVEETPEEPTYSITFIAEETNICEKELANLLNSLSSELLNSLYKTLKKGTEVQLPTSIYANTNTKEATLELTKNSICRLDIKYRDNITSVVVENEDIEIKYTVYSVEVLED